MWFKQLFSVLLHVCAFSDIYALKFGENCETTDNKQGICVHLTNCEPALNLINKRQMPSFCNQGTETNFNALVCCVDNFDEGREGRISEKMCRDYFPQFYDPNYKHHSKFELLGGRKSLAKEYPHMALIGYNEQPIFWTCGGSLISDQFVLTAAHCVVNRLGPPDVVRLGELDTANDTDDADPKDFGIKNIIVHPGFQTPSSYHDIALLELDAKVVFSLFIVPACLYPSAYTGDVPYVVGTGWGSTEFGGKRSSHLMSVNLQTVSHQKCKTFFKNSDGKIPKGIVDDIQVCAGGNEGKDTCGGDSGGPIQLIRPGTQKRGVDGQVYDLIGLTSFGIGCGIGDIPGVYTRIHFYIDWIEKNVWTNV